MALSEELKRIKQLYGEEFMKICRESFPTILEKEGVLLDILTKNFANNTRQLGQDIRLQHIEGNFADFVYTKYYEEYANEKEVAHTGKSPYDILKEAGYTLYEAKTEDEIQSYKKYYTLDEELCTFEGDRLARCHCFWAIKNNALEINREDFTTPQREDEYSTSVLAIQFPKHGACEVSIKSRYNHTVPNPDATYGNNLERIVPGLTESFGKMLLSRGINLEKTSDPMFEAAGYMCAPDGKYYKFNFMSQGKLYCPGNVVISSKEVKCLENPEQQILIDQFVLDLKEKTLKPYDDAAIRDCFLDAFKNIESIKRTKDKKAGETKLEIKTKDGIEPIEIIVDENNSIVEYINPNVKEIGNDFLKSNKTLKNIELANVKKVGMYFLATNKKLESIKVPSLEKAGSGFLCGNVGLTSFSAPSLKEVGNSFLNDNKKIENIEIPSLEKVGHYFLYNNKELTKIEAPNLAMVGNRFMENNTKVDAVIMPKLKKAQICGKDISKLDVSSKIATFEVNNVSRNIDSLNRETDIER